MFLVGAIFQNYEQISEKNEVAQLQWFDFIGHIHNF